MCITVNDVLRMFTTQHSTAQHSTAQHINSTHRRSRPGSFVELSPSLTQLHTHPDASVCPPRCARSGALRSFRERGGENRWGGASPPTMRLPRKRKLLGKRRFDRKVSAIEPFPPTGPGRTPPSEKPRGMAIEYYCSCGGRRSPGDTGFSGDMMSLPPIEGGGGRGGCRLMWPSHSVASGQHFIDDGTEPHLTRETLLLGGEHRV